MIWVAVSGRLPRDLRHFEIQKTMIDVAVPGRLPRDLQHFGKPEQWLRDFELGLRPMAQVLGSYSIIGCRLYSLLTHTGN